MGFVLPYNHDEKTQYYLAARNLDPDNDLNLINNTNELSKCYAKIGLNFEASNLEEFLNNIGNALFYFHQNYTKWDQLTHKSEILSLANCADSANITIIRALIRYYIGINNKESAQLIYNFAIQTFRKVVGAFKQHGHNENVGIVLHNQNQILAYDSLRLKNAITPEMMTDRMSVFNQTLNLLWKTEYPMISVFLVFYNFIV